MHHPMECNGTTRRRSHQLHCTPRLAFSDNTMLRIDTDDDYQYDENIATNDDDNLGCHIDEK